MQNDIPNGIFWHECEELGCHLMVEFDDEPKCFTHSPDSGSSLREYSAAAKAKEQEDAQKKMRTS